MFELEPATKELARVVEGVRDDQLGAPTPCSESTVEDLIDHVDGLSLAFTAAATKTSLDPELQAPRPDASRLGPGWRDRIRERLAALADAWRDDAAWRGMTQAAASTSQPTSWRASR